jgi:hypothetical protein
MNRIKVISFTQSNLSPYPEVTHLNFEHSTLINTKILKTEKISAASTKGSDIILSHFLFTCSLFKDTVNTSACSVNG